jgi:hypothetical protein
MLCDLFKEKRPFLLAHASVFFSASPKILSSTADVCRVTPKMSSW